MTRRLVGGGELELHGSVPRLGMSLVRLVLLVQIWQERAAERRSLAALDDTALKDVGITRTEAMEEWSKPFWRP
jgi:uncharacterized protein YjiS (DUF1127 family)